MIKSGRTVTELYSIISGGDYNFLHIQRAIASFRYQVEILYLDQLEKKFRELFNLAPFVEQKQNHSLNVVDQDGNNQEIYVSSEYFQKIKIEIVNGDDMLAKGYVIFIRKTKLFSGETPAEVLETDLRIELERMKLFLKHLEKALRLTRRGDIHFDHLFAFIPSENRIVKTKPVLSAESINKQFVYENRDNYALKIFLGLENRISGTVDLAMKNFVECFHIQNPKLRYINMLLCIDLCFNIPSGESFDVICRYVSSLLAKNEMEFSLLLAETSSFYQLKNRIITGNSLNDSVSETEVDTLNTRTHKIEEIIRLILKKMVRFNHKERNKFKEELKLKK